MVFFTCSHCGESLKKNKVEKHYHTICRGKPVAVTCVDCCKDFNEETVTAHTKCVTEEERYAAKGFTPKASANKGERKQQKWQDVIRTVKNTRTDLGQSEIQILSLLVNQENVPRKRNKFQNYLKTNLHGRYKEEIANRVFDILEEQSKQEEGKEKTDESQENGETEEKENVSLCENEEDKKQEPQTEKLSKKERKELKKKAKYEAQLKEIENEEAVEEKPAEEEDDEVRKKSKKSKKSKEEATEEPLMENGTEDAKSKKKHKSKPVENGNMETNNVEEEEHKSKKKRKKETAGEEEEEPAEKKTKDTELQEEEGAARKQKFNWEKVIVSLLEAKDEKELSLKRLKKKVLAELESCGETNTEKNLTKFNKKIHKIPAVVILKDKVRLKAA